ncbi:MAG: DEAD/DEAH box helicase, partial [Mycobacterium sp.]
MGRFSAVTREWFSSTFTAPTTAQAQAWDAIADGHHTLVIAPTGSGKTLAAFLWALDTLAAPAPPAATDDQPPGTRVLYVSPLKALAVDVERNLRTPLAGITRIAEHRGLAPPAISVGVRSGDTPPAQRRQLIAHPPDVLITTPESLFLMLTSAARDTLAGVQTVIVDEIHALATGKRGAHLALSLERLADLCRTRRGGPAPQRIGLSATVRPPEELARFLSGQAPTTIVAPASAKTIALTVQVPVPDMTNLAEAGIWPDVEARLVDLIESHHSTIVFANSRRLAERLTARLNEIHAERHGPEQAVLARAHHGSVSTQQRALVEDDLKRGLLKAVVATSSLELGIDMGGVDLVIQIEAPPSVASGLQRIGRAGHQVGEISHGVLMPKHRTDLIGCAVTAERMLSGQIETMRVPANPLDILAQHTVAAAALDPLDADGWFDTVRRSAPFAALPRSVYDATLDLLSG